MMKRRKLISVFMCTALLVTPDASAQFFKKLGKALQEVDKALDTTTTNQSNQENVASSAPEVSGDGLSRFYRPTEEDCFENGVYIAKRVPMQVYATSATKRIQMSGSIYSVYEFSDGVAWVEVAGENYEKRYVAIDTQGNALFTLKEEPNFKFQNGVGVTSRVVDGKKTIVLIDKTNKVIKSFPEAYAMTDFVDGVAAMSYVVKDQKGNRSCYVGYINTKGERIWKDLVVNGDVNKSLNKVRPFREGLSAVYDYKIKKWGYFDTNGNMVIKPQFSQVHDFSEGLAAVCVKVDGYTKWGYINTTGQFAIQPIFTHEVGNFGSGLAPVLRREGGYCFIDKSGNVKSNNYRQLTDFHNGFTIARGGPYEQMVLNKELKPISYITTGWGLPVADEPNSANYLLWEDDVMYAGKTMFTLRGDAILEDLCGHFRDGLAPWHGKGKDGREHIGYINPKGELVLEFVEPQF